MRRKMLLTIVLILAILLQSIIPLSVVNATTESTGAQIKLNSKLYTAVKTSLQDQGIVATYSDNSRTISISDSELDKVTYLNLANGEIDDLTGLSAFSSVSEINLTANELTKDSNLSELDSLPLKKLNLSSNKLESVSSISTFDTIEHTDITNQEVKGKEIITVDISEESDHVKTYQVVLPDILLKDTGEIDADWIEAEVEGEASVNWTSVNGNTVVLNIASGDGENYKALKGLITFKINVENSSSKIANTKMTLYSIIIDSNETGIIFEDENLYNAVKTQLTKGQTENRELLSYGNSGETLYLRAYDDALVLVINTNTLINKIPSLILHDKKISDLTGLEEFVGLNTELNLSYNYIDSIKRIIELDENKEKKEKELQEKYTKFLNNLKGYRTSLKTALEEYDKLQEEYEKLASAENPSETELANKAKEISTCATKISTYRTLVSNTLMKLYEIYNNEYLLTGLLPANIAALSYNDIYDANLETAKSYAESIMTKVSDLEKNGSLSDWESGIIIEKFEIPTTTTVTVKEDGEDVVKEIDIEYPITSYFDTLKEGSDLLTISDYENFIYQMKVIDNIVIAGNKCLFERLYNSKTSCTLSTGFDEYISDLDSIGLDITFATAAKNSYTTYTSECLCSEINADSLNEKISGKLSGVSSAEIERYIKLPRLKNLNLTDNSVESLDGIEALAELETLNVYKNLLDDITGVNWSSLTNLTYLDLGYNQLSSVKCLESLSNLQTLILNKNLLSGSFDFCLSGLKYLTYADFSDNQISDIAYFTNQFKFQAKAHGMKVEDYVLSEYCPTVSFKNQTLSMSTTVTSEGPFITINLPKIFAQAESIDYSRTSFGIDSLLGTVEANGKTVKLYTPSLGSRSAVVTIDGYNGNEYTTDGIAFGTTCTIKYDVVENLEPEEPVTPVEPTEPTDPKEPEEPVTPTDPTEPENPTEPTIDIEYGYTVVNNEYVIVNTPEIDLSTFANKLVKSEGYTVKVVNNENAVDSRLSTGAVASVDTADGQEAALLEVVTLGDVNGDGKVDALDSGIVRNVINDSTSLVGSYYEAADVNRDGKIDKLDSALILQYRADKISQF